MNREEFTTKLQNNVLCLDGATGTNMTLAGMPKGVCTETWILDNSEKFIQLQKAFIEAGSDVIYAPTFGANRKALERFDLQDQVRELNKRLVDLSKQAAEGKALVAGDISPTGLIPETAGGDASYEEIFDIYKEQAEALCEAGVDLIAVETMMSADETMIALDAVTAVCDLPVICSFSVYADGKCFYDGNIFDAALTLQEMGASAVGVNCCSGPDQVESIVSYLAKNLEIPVLAKPNAGMPEIDEKGNAIYELNPDQYAAGMNRLIEAGARMVGGCCGTEPAHIKALRSVIESRGQVL